MAALLFTPTMVEAILAGRKWETRRVPKRPGPHRFEVRPPESIDVREMCRMSNGPAKRPGVRWKQGPKGLYVHYIAGAPPSNAPLRPYTPSLHMPKWAVRLTLHGITVWREQLVITDELAVVEGFEDAAGMRKLWNEINPESPWQSRPDVLAIRWADVTDTSRAPEVPATAASAWNAAHGVGTKVRYYPVRPPTPGIQPVETATRSEAWTLGDGTPVVLVVGVTGGVHLDHLEVLT